MVVSVSGDWYPGRLTQAKATFQDKDGPIGLLLGRAGQTYGRLPQPTGRTDCQQSAQAQPAHPSQDEDDHPTGQQLGRDKHWHGRLPMAIDPCQELTVGPGAVGIPHLLGEVDPRPLREASTRTLMRNPEKSGWQRSQVTFKI